MSTIIVFLLVLFYVSIVIICAERIGASIILEAQWKLRLVQEGLDKLIGRKNALIHKKRHLSEEAMKIFTLYELTREITKCLHEKEALDLFIKRLRDHVSFKECHFFNPDDVQVKKYSELKQYFVFPLHSKGSKIGFLAIENISEKDQEKAVILGSQFALALKRVQLYEEIEKIAITDSLTGVYTRRHLLSRLTEEIQRSVNRKMSFSFLMVDIDHFKSINDQYGHLAGDQVLRELSSLIKQHIREIDIAGRFGGEEFCVILPDTDQHGAQLAAERLRESVFKASIKAYDTTLQTTISIGIATFPQDAENAEELIDKADWAMYRSKKNGRNQVTAFGSHKE